ncbi:hypothetical protein B296_00024146 [Ensete ventricosum]|uniref:Uncharacterized protein n=1 Tax=Ensete ventricosum TaxID=4639 RepID=A0A426YYQ6_ENSVE|nr:hypothetical protein B296_00024146 [Ensete ventricosum]
MSWCLQRRGPLYVSMFSPLLLVVVAVLGWAILDEKLYVGSVAGSVVIVGGLYLVLWGKGRETKKTRDAGGKETAADHEEGAIAAVGLTMFPSPPRVCQSYA